MTFEEVCDLIACDEHKNLELKKTTGELKDGMHSACAFLNTHGGVLVFGVTPNSLKILGQEVTETTRREVAHALVGLEPALGVGYVELLYPDQPNHPRQKYRLTEKALNWRKNK